MWRAVKEMLSLSLSPRKCTDDDAHQGDQANHGRDSKQRIISNESTALYVFRWDKTRQNGTHKLTPKRKVNLNLMDHEKLEHGSRMLWPLIWWFCHQ